MARLDWEDFLRTDIKLTPINNFFIRSSTLRLLKIKKLQWENATQETVCFDKQTSTFFSLLFCIILLGRYLSNV